MGRLNSLYSFLFAATFMPFLVFFMLAAKRQVWHATMQLFPAAERTEVKDALADVTRVLRSYLMGTALVGLILIARELAVFPGLGLRFSLLNRSGFRYVQSGPLPRRGHVVDSSAPHWAEAISHRGALSRNHRHAHSVSYRNGESIDPRADWLARSPQRPRGYRFPVVLGMVVGRHGLILAIPIMAVFKVICDHVERLQPVGRWLSA